jgi:hypothetical protein
LSGPERPTLAEIATRLGRKTLKAARSPEILPVEEVRQLPTPLDVAQARDPIPDGCCNIWLSESCLALGRSLFDLVDEAVAALLTARNNEEPAKAIEVSPKTLLRWQKLPEFERAHVEARMAAFRQATAGLQQALP